MIILPKDSANNSTIIIPSQAGRVHDGHMTTVNKGAMNNEIAAFMA